MLDIILIKCQTYIIFNADIRIHIHRYHLSLRESCNLGTLKHCQISHCSYKEGLISKSWNIWLCIMKEYSTEQQNRGHKEFSVLLSMVYIAIQYIHINLSKLACTHRNDQLIRRSFVTTQSNSCICHLHNLYKYECMHGCTTTMHIM